MPKFKKFQLILGSAMIALILLTSFSGAVIFQPFESYVTTLDSKEVRTRTTSTVVHKPTTTPYLFESFLNDFELAPDKPIFLYGQFSPLIFKIPSVASRSSRQFQLLGNGQDLCTVLELEWSSPKKKDFDISFEIIDQLGRPVYASFGSTGKKGVRLLEGIYRIKLNYSGVVPRGAAFAIRSKPSIDCDGQSAGYKSSTPEIPTLSLALPSISAFQFELIRSKHEEALLGIAARNLKGLAIDTLTQKVDGFLKFKGAAKGNKVKIWSAGKGDANHFSKAHPSMTIEVLGGSLPMGMSKFKLYGILTKEGLLDFVAGKMMEKEGISVPRWKLVKLEINGSHNGLYVLEESPSPNFFTAKQLHSSSISSLGEVFLKPKKTLNNAINTAPFVTDRDFRNLDRQIFAKTVSMISRFHGTHGIENTELRFIVDQMTGSRIPMVRDINVNYWAENGLAIRSYLVHGSWFIGDRFFGEGSHQNVKEGVLGKGFSEEPGLFCKYCYNDRTLGLAGINPAIVDFVKVARNRQLVEQYLQYYSSPIFFDKYKKQMHRFLDAVLPLFEKKVYTAGYENTLKARVHDPFANNGKDSVIARTSTSNIGKTLIVLVPGKLEGAVQRYSLYNFSPVTLDVSLPDSIIRLSADGGEGCASNSSYKLAPTPLFTQLTNELTEPRSLITYSRLSKRVIKTALNIDRSRFSNPEKQDLNFDGTPPFIDVCTSRERERSFIEDLKSKALFRSSGTTIVSKRKIVTLNDMPDENGSIKIEMNTDGPNKIIDHRQFGGVSFQQAGQFINEGGYTLRYIAVNHSNRKVKLNFDRLLGKPLPLWKSPATGGMEKSEIYISNEVNVVKVATRLITADSIKTSIGNVTLHPSKEKPGIQSTGLWIENLIPIVYGPVSPEKAQVAVIDFTIKLLDSKNANMSSALKETASLGQIRLRNAFLNQLLLHSTPNNLEFRVDEPAHIQFLHHSKMPKLVLPKKSGQIFEGDTVRLTAPSYSTQIIIEDHQTLILNPGQIIKFSENAGITVFGQIKSRGTLERPVVLKALRGKWRGISIINDGDPSRVNHLSHTTIQNAAGGRFNNIVQMGSLSLAKTHAYLDNVSILDPSAEDGVNFYHSHVKINGLTMSRSFDDSLDADWSYIELNDSVFTDCGGDCVDLNNSYAKINDVAIVNPFDKAFSIGEGSVSEISNSRATGGKIGIALKDQSFIYGENNAFEDFTSVPFVAYVKKPTFGFPQGHNLKSTTYNNLPMKLYEEAADRIISKYN